MFSVTDVVFTLIGGFSIGLLLGGIVYDKANKRKQANYECLKEDISDKVYVANNILLKISLWKMIIGFAPKDETGCYHADGCNFISDAFCRLGIESHTIDENMALWKIERLDKKLGEL